MKRALFFTLMLTACSGESTDTVAAEANTSADAVPEQPAAGPDFSSIGELTKPDDVDTELRGARVADPAEWQASFYSLSAGGSCTSSLIGDRVLLTAAHCVANGAAVTLRRNGQQYRALCEHSPGYGSGSAAAVSEDYALCAIDRSVSGVQAERINIDPGRLQVNGPVLLTGFGCTTDQGTGGNDGIYRIGDAKIVSLPAGGNNDATVTGEAGLCFGDSGGPAFIMGPGSARVQISVNSRVENKSPTGIDLGPKSFLSSTSTPKALAFFRDWSNRNKLRICGLDPQASPCRG